MDQFCDCKYFVQSHPDVNKNDPRSKERFVRVNEAYNVLIKPCSRREYDIGLKQSTHPRYTYTSTRYTDPVSKYALKHEYILVIS